MKYAAPAAKQPTSGDPAKASKPTTTCTSKRFLTIGQEKHGLIPLRANSHPRDRRPPRNQDAQHHHLPQNTPPPGAGKLQTGDQPPQIQPTAVTTPAPTPVTVATTPVAPVTTSSPMLVVTPLVRFGISAAPHKNATTLSPPSSLSPTAATHTTNLIKTGQPGTPLLGGSGTVVMIQTSRQALQTGAPASSTPTKAPSPPPASPSNTPPAPEPSSSTPPTPQAKSPN